MFVGTFNVMKYDVRQKHARLIIILDEQHLSR